jgi:hypothetical protein
MTQLTKNFSVEELTRTSVKADNTPTPEVLEALKALCEHILQPLREALGRPIKVNSGYRSPAVNLAVRGSKTSQHTKGEAADFECPGVANADLAEKIIELGLPFDQLILEFYTPGVPDSGWVHCSHRADGKNRGQVLTALRFEGKTAYKNGLCP